MNCECGCGKPTRIADKTDRRAKQIKGQPLRFLRGHAKKARPSKVALANVGNGLCECGCGRTTSISPRTVLHLGYVKGKPRRFISGHGGANNPLKMYVVDQKTGCWIWQGRIATNGYGTCGPRIAHIVVYKRVKGPIPEGLQLDHLCRNKPCVNPDHLEPVTAQENTRRHWEAVRDGQSA